MRKHPKHSGQEVAKSKESTKKLEDTPDSSYIQRLKKITNWKVMALLCGLTLAGGAILKSMNEKPETHASSTQKGENEKSATQSIDADTVTQRKKNADEWLDPLKKLSAASKNPKIKAIFAFIETYGSLAVPVENGFITVENKKSPYEFSLVTVTKNDAKKFDLWRHYSSENRISAGIFKPNEKLLILKGDSQISATWRGIILAHEGFHAQDFLSKPYNWHDSDTYTEHEVYAHDIQNALVSEIGGKKYQEYLKKEIERLSKALSAGKEKDTDVQAYSSDLDNVFGPTESEFEKLIRAGHLWIHASFSIIERDFPDHFTAKRKFLTLLYGDAKKK